MTVAKIIFALTLMLGLLAGCSRSPEFFDGPGQTNQPCLKKPNDNGTETDGGIGGTGHTPEECTETPNPV